MKHRYLLALATAFWTATPLPAEEAKLTLEEVMTKIEQAQKELKTLRARITHTREIPLLEVKETMSGKLLFKATSEERKKLLIIFTKPEEQKNLIEGNEVTVYTPSKKQAEKYKLDKATSGKAKAFGIGFMESVAAAKKDFGFKLLGQEALDGTPTAKLEMKPKPGKDAGPYDKVQIWFETKRWVPLMIKLFESDGEVITTIRLRDVKLNKRIWDWEIKLKLPSGTEVIRPLE